MKIALIGNGGHSKVIKDMIKANSNHEIIAVLDDNFHRVTYQNNCCFAPISHAPKLSLEQREVFFVVAIGANEIRKQIVYQAKIPNQSFVNVIHPTAVVSPRATLGKGVVVMPNAVINADTVVGDHVIVNSGAVVEHDNQLEDYVHVSPNATLTGNVRIGEGTQIGAGATVIPGISIGNWSIVGAGSTVIHDLPSNCKAVGCPARLLEG